MGPVAPALQVRLGSKMIAVMIGTQPFPAHDGPFPRLIQPPSAPPLFERARGRARLSFYNAQGETRLDAFYQSGSAKIRLPRVPAGVPKEAVFLNTAGGVTGGDHLAYEVVAGAGAKMVVTTQAAERVYRRLAGTARVETSLTVEDGAELAWLPQETILFDNSALTRRLSAEVALSGSLLAAEAIVLGRTAMGETARNVLVNDGWRVRRGGRLVFADGLRLDGDAAAIMAGKATGSGATALATLLLVAPDAEAMIEAAHETLHDGQSEGGASAWNGMLVARLVAPSGQSLRADLIRLIERLRGARMPRVWQS
jgi:urease accessory protein